MPKFTKQHYEAIAKILKGHTPYLSNGQMGDLVSDFERMFGNDNVNFDQLKFEKAIFD